MSEKERDQAVHELAESILGGLRSAPLAFSIEVTRACREIRAFLAEQERASSFEQRCSFCGGEYRVGASGSGAALGGEEG